MGVTANCNRNCTDCPSAGGDHGLNLDFQIVKRLFLLLKGKTKGLIVTGGEPTLYEYFSDTLKSGRQNDFEDITVVTNGSYLHKDTIFNSLTEYASAVRVSLYNWMESDLSGLVQTMRKIEKLKSKALARGSELSIGVSALTSRENSPILDEVARISRENGADWIYFHPTCTGDGTGAKKLLEQQYVLEEIKECSTKFSNDFHVYFLDGRYGSEELKFKSYHAAHFILVMGADSKNYVATEAKYQSDYVLWDLKNNWKEEFLWDTERLKIVSSFSNENFSPKESKNRGVLYNSLLERMISKQKSKSEYLPEWDSFYLPHII
ncbi:hypothetical protein BVY01_00085 [bacterium I07]|nr:hypothetical protein BVY01_00085 [bacterium I07]